MECNNNNNNNNNVNPKSSTLGSKQPLQPIDFHEHYFHDQTPPKPRQTKPTTSIHEPQERLDMVFEDDLDLRAPNKPSASSQQHDSKKRKSNTPFPTKIHRTETAENPEKPLKNESKSSRPESNPPKTPLMGLFTCELYRLFDWWDLLLSWLIEWLMHICTWWMGGTDSKKHAVRSVTLDKFESAVNNRLALRVSCCIHQ